MRKPAIMLLAAALLPCVARPIDVQTESGLEWKQNALFPSSLHVAVVDGSLTESKPLLFRIKAPAGAAMPMQWHPGDIEVTVLEGLMEVVSKSGSTSATSGDHFRVPAREPYAITFLRASIVQVRGFGPWKSIAVEGLEAPPVTARLILRSISPTRDSPLTARNRITATIDYEIDGFQPDTFFPVLQFDTPIPGRTIGSRVTVTSQGSEPPPPPRPPTLTQSKGTTEVSADLARIWPELAHPVRVRVFLNRMTDARKSDPVAESEVIEYQTQP